MIGDKYELRMEMRIGKGLPLIRDYDKGKVPKGYEDIVKLAREIHDEAVRDKNLRKLITTLEIS